MIWSALKQLLFVYCVKYIVCLPIRFSLLFGNSLLPFGRVSDQHKQYFCKISVSKLKFIHSRLSKCLYKGETTSYEVLVNLGFFQNVE